jgi:toxin YoeB
MSYSIELTKDAYNDIEYLRKSGEKAALKKLDTLLEELKEHPYSGSGKPKPLRGNRNGQWSRRINSKHRLVYTVQDDTLLVLVVSASGHYDD